MNIIYKDFMYLYIWESFSDGYQISLLGWEVLVFDWKNPTLLTISIIFLFSWGFGLLLYCNLLISMTGLLAKKAVEKGLSVMPYIKTSMSPGSGVVTYYLQESGVMKYLQQLG